MSRAPRKKSSWLKWLFVCLSGAFLIAVIVFFFVLAPIVGNLLNPVTQKPPYAVSPAAAELHARLFVADMHADSLLWNRNLLVKSAVGHVDVPRMREGNLALQFFTVVTKSPRFLNLEKNAGDTDDIFWLTLAQRQPLETLNSLTKRALRQAFRLHQYAEQSGGKLILIKNKRDLAVFLERRQTEKDLVAGILGIEGAHALDGKPENVDLLFDAGFRMMSPSHFFDSEMGGSVHGVEKYGLTDKGREMLRRMETRKMLFDVAHASPAAIDDALKIAAKPIVVSHTGVTGTCPNNRNLSDEQIRAVAKTGGVIAIGFWASAVCESTPAAIGRAIRHAANIVGADHVALGSDFDGSVETAFDASGMALVTEALMRENFSPEEIEKIMGGNVLRILSQNLPD